MKIIFDKTKDDYQYPIDQKNLKVLFSIIPEEWKTRIKIMHFLGQEPHQSEFDRPVKKLFLSSKVNLSVKGLEEKEIVTELLIELLQDTSFGNNLRAGKFNILTKEQRKKTESIVRPYVEKYFDMKQKENA